MNICPYGAVEMKDKDGKPIAHVLEALFKGCGACGPVYPTEAIVMGHFTTEEIPAQIGVALLEAKA